MRADGATCLGPEALMGSTPTMAKIVDHALGLQGFFDPHVATGHPLPPLAPRGGARLAFWE